jgi:hypothetical protein
MSDLTPRPRSGLTRQQREQRAYRLVLAGGTAAVVAVVCLVLAVVGIFDLGPAILAALVAVLCAWAFRRTVSG